MSKPEQHLPEKSFNCRDCNQSFPSAEAFSDHFTRLAGPDNKPTIIITGCSTPEGVAR